MKRNQSKKRRIRTALVSGTPNDEIALNGNSHQSVPSSIPRASHHPLEVGYWLAGIAVGIATLILLVYTLSGWRSGSRDVGGVAVRPSSQQPSSMPSIESNNPGATINPNNLAAQSSTSANDSRRGPNLDPNTTSMPANSSKPGNAALVGEHLARANLLYRKQRYSEALAECDRALHIDGGNRKARALRTEIRTAEILAENDSPKQ